jgi:hypothetical protein
MVSNLVQSWKDSLFIFDVKKSNLFYLVTLKTIRDLYLKLIYMFWWLALLIIVPGLLYQNPEKYFYRDLSIWMSVALLAVRPSVELKTYSYFFTYYIYHFLVVLTLVPLMISGYLLGAVLSLMVWIIFFYLDDLPKNIITAVRRALYFYWYNLPLCLIITGSFIVVQYLLALITEPSPLIARVIKLAVMPLFLGILSNVYVKRVHDQFDLYFNFETDADHEGVAQ